LPAALHQVPTARRSARASWATPCRRKMGPCAISAARQLRR